MSLFGNAKAQGSVSVPGTIVVTVAALILAAVVVIVKLVFQNRASGRLAAIQGLF